jgi:hypothetical protein
MLSWPTTPLDYWMSTPAERTRRYTARDLRLRQLDHLTAVLERDPDDWQTIERFSIQGQLLRAWDWALQEHDYAVRFTLAVRRYCAVRNLEREYLERGRQISVEARLRALPEDDVQLLLSLGPGQRRSVGLPG